MAIRKAHMREDTGFHTQNKHIYLFFCMYDNHFIFSYICKDKEVIHLF